jgi:hypothetical protein
VYNEFFEGVRAAISAMPQGSTERQEYEALLAEATEAKLS